MVALAITKTFYMRYQQRGAVPTESTREESNSTIYDCRFSGKRCQARPAYLNRAAGRGMRGRGRGDAGPNPLRLKRMNSEAERLAKRLGPGQMQQLGWN